MGSMKQEYMQKIKHEMELSRKYADGYEDGCADGYEQALQDIKRLRTLAVDELLKGLGK
jgi:flagellar biosynthesis/type III secretory pathway protein FliH